MSAGQITLFGEPLPEVRREGSYLVAGKGSEQMQVVVDGDVDTALDRARAWFALYLELLRIHDLDTETRFDIGADGLFLARDGRFYRLDHPDGYKEMDAATRAIARALCDYAEDIARAAEDGKLRERHAEPFIVSGNGLWLRFDDRLYKLDDDTAGGDLVLPPMVRKVAIALCDLAQNLAGQADIDERSGMAAIRTGPPVDSDFKRAREHADRQIRAAGQFATGRDAGLRPSQAGRS